MFYVRLGKHGVVTAAWTEGYDENLDPQTAGVGSHGSLENDDPRLLKYLTRSELAAKLFAVGLSTDDSARCAVRVGMFIDRDAAGYIVAVWPAPQRDRHELLPMDDPGLKAFLARESGGTAKSPARAPA